MGMIRARAEDELVDKINRYSEMTGMNQSQAIRFLIRAGLERSRSEPVDLVVAELRGIGKALEAMRK